MPSGRFSDTLYTATGNVEAMNVSVLYKPGELGSKIEVAGKGYQLIQVDSGATASTVAGHAPQCGDVAFWKDRSKYLVTNDRTFAGNAGNVTNSRNMVAGVFCSPKQAPVGGDTSITPGNYGFIQQRGQHVGVLTSANTLANGLIICCSSSTTAPDGVNIAVASSPVGSIIGVATAANGAVTATYTPAVLGGADLVDIP